jgi:hypothetical protein
MAISIVSRYLFTAFLCSLSFAIEMENLFPLRKTHSKRNENSFVCASSETTNKKQLKKTY